MNIFSLVGKIKDIKSFEKVAYITICVKSAFTKQDQYDYIDVTSFSPEWIQQYFWVDKWIAVTGHIHINKREDETGKPTYKTELIADKVYFVGDKTTEQQVTEESLPWAEFENL